MKKIILFIGFASLFTLILLAAACSSGTQPTAANPVPGKVIKAAPIGNNLTVTLSNDTGKLKNGEQEIFLSFTDAAGKAVDVGMVNAAALNFQMPAMGSILQSGYRAFPSESVRRIRFIKQAQELGFSLKEIKELLALQGDPDSTGADVKKRAKAKIAGIEEKIKTLRAMKKALRQLTASCNGSGSITECPILESLSSEKE